jgi:hypothetical protein
MLYYLYELGEWARKAGHDSDFFKALNVFSYITFRAICAAATAFLENALAAKPADLHAVVAGFGDERVDEYRIAFSLLGESDIARRGAALRARGRGRAAGLLRRCSRSSPRWA